uniref:Cytochrome P450 86A2 n=1 Tax=Aegilops tauschii TaxID=37682 RepID=M8CQ32_AEGTA
MEAVSWHRRWDGMPTNWPVVGSVSTITVNAGRMHEWLTEFLSVAPGMSHVARGPWGSPVDILLTANPADVAHVFTTNFGNYPKGEEFAVLVPWPCPSSASLSLTLHLSL